MPASLAVRHRAPASRLILRTTVLTRKPPRLRAFDMRAPSTRYVSVQCASTRAWDATARRYGRWRRTVEAGAEFTFLWTTSRPQRMRESRNHRNDADENERREEAHAQRQYRPNTSTLRRGLSVGSQRPAPVFGKMH